MNLDRVIKGLESLGMNVRESRTETGDMCLEAAIDTKRGCLSVYVIEKGARLQKPNGSHKYLYECSDAKLRAVVLQTIKANS